jgi:hypothetical protein
MGAMGARSSTSALADAMWALNEGVRLLTPALLSTGLVANFQDNLPHAP